MGLETARRGVSTVEGVCRYCGLVKRYPAFRGKKKSGRAKSATTISPKIEVSGLAPVRAADTIDWATAFDAVCHVGAWAGIRSHSDRHSDGREQSLRGRV